MYEHRIAVWNDTHDYADCIPAPPASKKFRWLDQPWQVASVGMQTSVHDQDCLAAGKELMDNGFNPVVLNLSDNLVPGGLVAQGSGAQEESIWRRSNYVRTLTESFYPCKVWSVKQLCQPSLVNTVDMHMQCRMTKRSIVPE